MAKAILSLCCFLPATIIGGLVGTIFSSTIRDSAKDIFGARFEQL